MSRRLLKARTVSSPVHATAGAGGLQPASGLPPTYPFTAARTDPDLHMQTRRAGKRAARDLPTPRQIHKRNTGFNLFPFSSFKYSLTLFSKFFASFAHATCSLSVSHQYLALEGIYLPLRAAVPSNSTLRMGSVQRGLQATYRSVTFCGSPFPRDLSLGLACRHHL